VERLDRADARLGLAALVIVALTGILTSRSVRRPALRLVDAARSLAAGDFEPARGLGRHGAEGHRRDELTELSGAFRSMSIELKSREERLIRLNERIQAQQEELQAQFEELQSQHEELQAQGEELQSQNEELRAQAEELQAQDQELHRTVDRLAASEERYHGLFTHLSEAFALHELVYDESGRALDYRFLVANQAFEQATGLEASRVIGRTVRQVIPDIEAFWIERYAEVVRTRRPARFESFAAALGRHYQVVAFAVGVDRFATLFMDVTQQKRAEQALRQADRNKSDFIALLSHELRNPLASISNGVHVLGRAEPGSEEAEHARAVIARQVGQLTCLVEDLLDVERISRGKLELRRTALDLRHLVADIVDDCRASLVAAGVGLEVDLPAEPLHVNGDATRLSQVVGNLLQNAVKFTPSGGRVVVSLQVQDGSARLSVRDSGAGIEPHMLERLFQPFMQAKDGPARSKSGLGLGLALVKALVERHGGSVTASSEGPGRGSDFVVVLPLGSEESAIAEPRLEKSGGWARRRVLVIEDNVDAAESLRDLLVLEGHDVEIAHTGVEGVEKARACRPQVVLCDIGLPDVSGHEVAATFREDPLLQSVYLIALTGYALPEDIEKATAAGFDEHLPKPPAIERLHQILAALPPAGLPASDEA
jgi:two-component system CheB/CheR fusion protein